MSKRRQRRGKQTRKTKGASICTGLAPEEEVFEEMDLEYESAFGCECKPAAIQFLLLNRTLGCIFTDLQTMVDRCGGYCAAHAWQWCDFTKFLVKYAIDIFVAGVSCRPYSLARSKRRSDGFEDHADHWMSEGFLACLLNMLPKCAILENVAGFVMTTRTTKDGRTVTTNPLKAFMARLKEVGVLNYYVVKVLFLAGQVFVPQTRNRVYILFMSRKHGGKRAADRAERWTKDYF